MIPIFIASLSTFSGKNLICLGLGLKFKKDGHKIGYFKPVGFSPIHLGDVITDEDALFLSKVLEVNEPLDSICPVILTDDLIKRLMEGEELHIRQKTMAAFHQASAGKDIMIARGIGRLSGGTSLGFSELDFIQESDARVIFVDKFESSIDMLDGFIYASKILKDKLLGVVFNLIPPARLPYVQNTLIPFLKANGITTLGIIPKDPVLGAVPIKEIVHSLQGKVLCCEDKIDDLIEHFVIGAMNVESALRYFRKVSNKAVITGGDRSDILLAALETPTKCLILTGELYPSASILGRAQEAGIPVVVVGSDTAETIETCENLSGCLSLHFKSKVQRAAEVVEREIDFHTIYQQLKLSK
ncbi:MAG: phosphotransacetylase family protein [wastewater metagenome]|nr:phosphotransacetylase family protein [Candidatus Loosdrechtia aerotolerans]